MTLQANAHVRLDTHVDRGHELSVDVHIGRSSA